MAIIIPSKRIYDIKNSKVIDNIITGVGVIVDELIKKTGVFGDTVSVSLFSYESDFGYENTVVVGGTTYTYKGKTTYVDIGLGDKNPYKLTTVLDVLGDGSKRYVTTLKIDISNLICDDSNTLLDVFANYNIRGIQYVYPTGDYLSVYADYLDIRNVNDKKTGSNDGMGLSVTTSKSGNIVTLVAMASVPKGNEDLNIAFYYFPIDYTLQLYGNNYVPKELSKSYGTNPNFTLNSNELMQVNTKVGATEIAEYIANIIKTDYISGKETAIIQCSINEYYDESNNLAISTKQNIGGLTKMIFAEGDEVIPQRKTNNGDIEIAKYSDGTPKVFKVLASKIINNGAIFQEITVQEIKQ